MISGRSLSPVELVDRAGWINARALVHAGRPLVRLTAEGHLVLRDDVPAEPIEARQPPAPSRPGRGAPTATAKGAGRRTRPKRQSRADKPLDLARALRPLTKLGRLRGGLVAGEGRRVPGFIWRPAGPDGDEPRNELWPAPLGAPVIELSSVRGGAPGRYWLAIQVGELAHRWTVSIDPVIAMRRARAWAYAIADRGTAPPPSVEALAAELVGEAVDLPAGYARVPRRPRAARADDPNTQPASPRRSRRRRRAKANPVDALSAGTLEGILAEQPRTATAGAWSALVRRDGAIGRWWPVPLEALPDDAAVVRVPGDGGRDALAGIAEVVAEHVDAAVRRLVIAYDQAAILDTLPHPLQRAARWAVRRRAQLAGESPARRVAWAELDDVQLLDDALVDPELAERLLDDVDGHRVVLDGLPIRGPDPSPALVGPAAFARAWAARGDLASGPDRKVRTRKAPQGRRKRLTLAQYIEAREALAGQERPTNDVAICRHLRQAEVIVSRTVVRQRRLEFEHAVAELGPTECASGVQAVTSMVGATPRVTTVSEPFMHWVGSKRRLLRELLAALRPLIDAQPDGRLPLYVEPCIGGGALLLELAQLGLFERAIAADADPDIIHLWRWVQRDPDQVFEKASAWPWTSQAFEEAREALNRVGEDALGGIGRAGAILRVNRHARNGLWRRRKDGGLNMPAGERKGQTDLGFGVERLREVSRLIHDVEFVCADAEDVVDSLGGAGVVYVDPPYWPLSKTSGFCGYGGRGFQAGDLVRFIAALRRHAAAGGVGLLSNASNAPVLDLIEGAQVTWVSAWRSVSVKVDTRGATPEIIARWTPRAAARQKAA